MGANNFLRFFPDPATPGHLSQVEIGVVRVASGADVRAVQQELQRRLGQEDVRVLTKGELIDLEQHYWATSTAIGYIFPLGMGVGLVIGVLICFQVLYSNVSSYLPQFATLKAMGFTDRFLVGVVLQQALFLALLGFVPAAALSWVLFRLISGATGLLMYLNVWRLAFVLFLTVVMCMVAGVFAVRDVLKTDPAEVFR
jgi:putative ABC transport system permease protein